jgi:hypothetical protein
MKSAPSSLHRPRSSAPPLAVGVSLLGALGLSGCLVELPPLVDDGIGGFSGTGGTPAVLGGSGGSGVPGGSGGNGGNDGPDQCGAGSKQCPGVSECVSTTDPEFGCSDASCAPCSTLDDTVVMGCSDDGQCQVQGCREGFADCNGDALGRSGAALGSSNGCEYSFGAVSPSSEPLLVPTRNFTIDGERADWNGIPVYTLEQACINCGDERAPEYSSPPLSSGSAPPTTDLDAYFRIAWDASNLYLLAEAYDDHLYTTDVPADQHPGANEDGVVMFFDGLNNRQPSSSYGNDDTRVYIGLSENHEAFNRPLQAGQVAVVAQQNGLCYRLEAQISWRAIVGFDEQNSQGQLPPTPDKSYGFDISFNDWDPAPGGAEPVAIQHQHQVFWVDPGAQWWNFSQGWGGMKLLGEGASSADAGAP